MNRVCRIALLNHYDDSWVAGTEYIKNVILSLSRLSQEEQNTFEIHFVTRKTTDGSLLEGIKPFVKAVYFVEDILGPCLSLKEFHWKIASILTRRPFYRYEKFLRKQKYDFVYPYFSSRDDEYYHKSAALIFDFQHKYLAKNFPRKEVIMRDRHFRLTANNASKIVLSSRCAEQDFQQFFPQSAHKSRVMPFRSVPSKEWFENNPVDTQKKYSLPDRFFLISNQLWKHKNHIVVLEALKLLKQEGIDPIVVCTGHTYDYRHPRHHEYLLQIVREYKLTEQVFILGLIPKIDQIQLLRRSIAIIQPSLFEGWSTFVEESRCFGKYVILSDIPVHLEQNPQNSKYFRSTSPDSLASCIATWWKTLPSGPDHERESIARDSNERAVRAFARTFLEISHEFEG